MVASIFSDSNSFIVTSRFAMNHESFRAIHMPIPLNARENCIAENPFVPAVMQLPTLDNVVNINSCGINILNQAKCVIGTNV